MDKNQTLGNIMIAFMNSDPLLFTSWAIKMKNQFNIEWPMEMVLENKLIVRNNKKKD